jgi:hypothetical protein
MTIFKLAFAVATLFFSACVLETAEDENNPNPITSSNIEMSSGKEISSSTEMSSNTPISSSSQEIKPCTKEYAPVCAEGKTFGNACQAKAAGHHNFSQGTCEEFQICTEEYAPICADGKTFGNACKARAAGYFNFRQGACEEFQICTQEYAPVCADGKTFGNACEARAAGHFNFRQGACEEFQICTQEYAPVCAESKTFGNACEARAAGFQNFSQGACESICPQIKLAIPLCLVGNPTPVYDGGCLIDYKCPSSEAQCYTMGEKACLSKEGCEWSSISIPVVLSQDLDSQTLNLNNSPVEGFCASKQPSVCPVFSMTPDFCSQGKTLAWELDSMGCESPVCVPEQPITCPVFSMTPDFCSQGKTLAWESDSMGCESPVCK